MKLSGTDREAFEREALRIVNAARDAGVQLRLLGALAFKVHCPQFGYLQAELGRIYTDIDFAAYRSESKNVVRFFTTIGYDEDREVNTYFGGSRLIFHNDETGLHTDVFIDKLDFCHEIPWNGRLEVDFPTLPLAELLLEKMQIVKINEKDVIDTIMLLREHPVGQVDEETINAKRVAQLCAAEWGLWRTVNMNLDKIRQLMLGYEALTDEDREIVNQRIDTLLEVVEAEPKPFSWKIRAKVGDKKKWYKDVEEV